MSHETAINFVRELLANDDIRQKAKALERNDWDGLQKIAQDANFDVAISDLKMALPSRFYQGYGEHPDKGWDMPEEKIAQLKKKE
ncbi:MAG TPA: hypothetical protein PK530_08220 [Anaerolineales bacterium]|nr:hypothetical protein [Anaerolineales bacterium]